jgi:hypothetical protein
MMGELVNLNECWNKPLHGRLVATAVASNQVPRFPWEVALFGERDGIPDRRVTLKLPAALLAPITTVREALMELLQPVMQKTVVEWSNTVNTNALFLQGLLVHFDLEIAWLNKEVPQLIRAKAQDDIASCFPQVPGEGDFKQILADVSKLKGTKVFLAGGAEIDRLLTAVVDLSRDLLAGRGPEQRVFEGFSEFYKMLYRRCENIIAFKPTLVSIAGQLKLPSAGGFILGRKAIEFIYSELSCAIAANGEPKALLGKTKLLRTFTWILDSKEVDQVDLWVRILVGRTRETVLFGTAAIKDDDAMDGSHGMEVALVSFDGLSGAASSSTDRPTTRGLTKSLSTPAKSKADSAKEAHQHRVTSFFMSKKNLTPSVK